MNLFSFSLTYKRIVWFAAFSVVCLARLQAQPMVVSTVPANLASGVSPSAAVVFTFSEAMNPDATTAEFRDTTTFAPLPTTPVWSAANKVLTCTPTPAFPSSRSIVWNVSGENPAGDSLADTNTAGFFTTGSGSGGGNTGSGTNKITAFAVGKLHLFDQTSTAAPTLDDTNPYGFSASTALASNRTASGITVTLPSGSVSNLTQNFVQPESYYLFAVSTNLASFDNTYPFGNYGFNVQSATTPLQVTVNLPASLVQPNAPHTTSFTAGQTVDPSKSFTLSWDAFQNGTASDFISVIIGSVFQTPNPGTAGALAGTVTSVVIPAGTFQTNSSYDASIGFYRSVGTSNSTYSTIAYLATSTRFTLNTVGGVVTSSLTLTNGSWSGGTFSFDVTSAAGQTLTVESSANLKAGQWQTLLTTNSATGRVRITDLHSTTNRSQFYRAR